MKEDSVRLDLIVAFIALAVSTIAAGASVYQSFAIRQQLSAQIWPYLDIGTTLDPKFFEVDLTNDGLGPALIERVSLTYEGKPIKDYSQVVRAEQTRLRAAAKPADRPAIRLSTTTMSPGDVMPPGHVRRLLRVDTHALAQFAIAEGPKTSLEICYCSLLAQCWLLKSQDIGRQPETVGSCS